MKPWGNQKGAAIVEFAILFVFLLAPIVFGIVDFGFGWVQSHYIENAAREGARVAAKLPDPEGADQAAVQQAVQDYLGGFYSDVSSCCGTGAFIEVNVADDPIDPDDLNLPATRVTVTVRTSDFWDPILPGFLIDFPTSLTKTSVFAKETN